MKHTCCLLFPLLILASGGIAMDTPPNREVQINVLQFLHRDSASTVVDAHLIKREIESTLLKCGRTCEASLRSVRRIEPVEQLFSSVRDIGTPAADRAHDVLNVWGWVESFDVSRVRMILSLETTNSGSYAFFHDVEIQAGRIVRWDGRQCNLDMMALASPISVFAIVVADNNQTERGALRKFIEECSPHARHICADAEFEYLRAGGARPPETSKAVRLLYGEAQSDSALLPIPALWHRDLIRFMTRSAGPSPYAVPTIAVSTGKSTEWPIAVAVGAAGV